MSMPESLSPQLTRYCSLILSASLTSTLTASSSTLCSTENRSKSSWGSGGGGAFRLRGLIVDLDDDSRFDQRVLVSVSSSSWTFFRMGRTVGGEMVEGDGGA